MPSAPVYTLDRPLGLVEKFQTVKRILNSYGSVAILAKVALPHGFDTDTESVRARFVKAAETVCKQQPALRSFVVDHLTETPRWAVLEAGCIDYPSLVKVAHHKDAAPHHDGFSSMASPSPSSALTSAPASHPPPADGGVGPANAKQSHQSAPFTTTFNGRHSPLVGEWLRHTFRLEDMAPLWSLRVITGLPPTAGPDGSEECTIIVAFVFDHLVTDATGATVILKEILDAFFAPQQPVSNSASTDEGTQLTPTLGSRPSIAASAQLGGKHPASILPPPLDLASEHQPNWLTTLRLIPLGELLLPKSLRWISSPNYWSGVRPPVRGETHRSEAFMFTIPPRKLAALIESARRNRTTVHAALWRLIAESITLSLASKKKRGDNVYHHPTVIKSYTPANARPLCDPSAVIPVTVGNYTYSYSRFNSVVSSTTSLIDVPTFWRAAQNYKLELEENRVSALQHINLLKFLGKFPQKWTRFFARGLEEHPPVREASFEISNLGVCSPSDDGSIRVVDPTAAGSNNNSSSTTRAKWRVPIKVHPAVRSLIFAQSANVTGPALTWNIVTIPVAPPPLPGGRECGDEGGPTNGHNHDNNDKVLQLFGTITWQAGAFTLNQVRDCYSMFCEMLNHIISVDKDDARRESLGMHMEGASALHGKAPPSPTNAEANDDDDDDDPSDIEEEQGEREYLGGAIC
ncbi:hypothetical protein EV182_000213 [Spiromyces aspiralis]|uniref:Uncharacterized protein n=1 Tax=Spiromyces aspiralis TaxID=68401 RepID=A0ACC1HIT2_9FUNG|nr:hypothetical protein EV182_000213 [Spiromyces aspiralis]